MRTDLHLRWLKLKRHLRSCATSTRALRDQVRALSHVPALPLEGLCRLSARLAA